MAKGPSRKIARYPHVHQFPDILAYKIIGLSPEVDIGKYVLIPGDPKRVEKIASFFEDAKKVGEFREHVVYTGFIDGIRVSAISSGAGAPNAAMTIEAIAKTNATTVIRVGTSGALQPEIQIGDLVIPTAAVRGDGVTREYVPLKFPAVADWDVVNTLLEASKKFDIPVHSGIVWTHDALFRESEERIKFWYQAGVLSVEMECSAVFTISHLRGLRAGAILAIDGNLVQKQQFKGALEGIVGKSIETEIQIALEAIKILDKSTK